MLKSVHWYYLHCLYLTDGIIGCSKKFVSDLCLYLVLLFFSFLQSGLVLDFLLMLTVLSTFTPSVL